MTETKLSMMENLFDFQSCGWSRTVQLLDARTCNRKRDRNHSVVLRAEFLTAETPKFELNCHHQRRATQPRDACSLVTTAVFAAHENGC